MTVYIFPCKEGLDAGVIQEKIVALGITPKCLEPDEKANPSWQETATKRYNVSMGKIVEVGDSEIIMTGELEGLEITEKDRKFGNGVTIGTIPTNEGIKRVCIIVVDPTEKANVTAKMTELKELFS